MDNSTTVQYAGLIHELADKARSTVRDIDPTNDLTFLRIRSKKHEIMVAPGNKDYMYMYTVIDLKFQTLAGPFRWFKKGCCRLQVKVCPQSICLLLISQACPQTNSG